MNAITKTNYFSARLFAFLTALSLLGSLIPVQALAVNIPETPALNPSVDICHASNSQSNPYSNGKQIVDANSIINGGNAHDGHDDGGLDDMGDIIPPFQYGEPENPTSYPGKNWNFVFSNGMTGQEIALNDCEVPTEGTIIIDKVTVPANEPDSFTFTTTGSGFTGFSLTHSSSPNSQNLTAGTYSVSESPLDGWTQTDAVCVSSKNDVEIISALDLDVDETITCTFTNTKDVEEVLGCTDPDAENYNQEATSGNADAEDCTYDDGRQVITACKYETNETPVEGWGMTITNDVGDDGDVTFDDLLTEEDGCVSVSVYPEDGPFYVTEEIREGWTQESVFDLNGQVHEGEIGSYCEFFDDELVLDKSIESFDSIIIDTEPEYRCEFYNEEEQVAPLCKNLLTNGSFEEPIVTNGDLWQKFASVAGWVIEKVSDATATTLEIHRGWSGNDAAEGEQYAELDGDHSTKVLQNVPTIPGALYELSWAFAPRHNITAEQNQLSVAIDGVEVDTEGPATASAGLTSTDWTRSNYQFSATDTSIDISFADAGPSNSYGTFLDDAVLCLVREPVKDVCPNIDDIQGTLPEGYVFNNAGQCVPEIINTCLVPSTLGDETEFLINNSGEKTVAEMLADHGYVAVDTTNDQVNYQVWNLVDPTADTITFNLKVLGKRAGNTQILGYYKAGDGSTFASVLTQVSDTDGEVVVPVTIPAFFATSFGFGIKSDDMTWYSEKTLNSDSKDHVAVYNPVANKYLLAFEDFNNLGDGDYNDLVVEIADVKCVPPPPPIDMCLNIEDVQEYVPKGMYQNQAGNCLPLEDDEIINTCLVPNTLEDNSEFVMGDSGEKSVAEMLADHGYVAVDTTNDQINYQVWDLVDPSADTITFNVKVLGKRAGNTQILGYYKAGDGLTFTSVLTQVSDTDGEVSIPVTIPAAFATSFGFGIKSDDMTWYSETALNLDSKDHVAVYNPVANKYLLAFEDINNLGDNDYNDLVIEIADVACNQENDDENPEINESSTSGGGGGSRSNRSGNPTVAGDSISVPEPTPLVLGEQVSVVPVGAPGAGEGGTSNDIFTKVYAAVSTLRRRVKMG